MSEYQIPDGIEPVEAWRVWTVNKDLLLSFNGHRWTPGERMEATCICQCYGVNIRDGESYFVDYHPIPHFRWGITRASLAVKEPKPISVSSTLGSWTTISINLPMMTPPLKPTTVLPHGLAYTLETVEEPRHEAPDHACSCGIYAVTNLDAAPVEQKHALSGGRSNVIGKVKIWGKIVPGSSGYRGQFAYPSEFHVAKKLLDHPVLQSFGVPIFKKKRDLSR